MTSSEIRLISFKSEKQKPTSHFSFSGGGLKKLEAGGILNAPPPRARRHTHTTDAHCGVLPPAKSHIFMLHGWAGIGNSTQLRSRGGSRVHSQVGDPQAGAADACARGDPGQVRIH